VEAQFRRVTTRLFEKINLCEILQFTDDASSNITEGIDIDRVMCRKPMGYRLLGGIITNINHVTQVITQLEFLCAFQLVFPCIYILNLVLCLFTFYLREMTVNV